MINQETKLPEPDGAIEKSEGFNGIGQEEFTYIDAYSADTVRFLIAEAEQRMKERCVEAALDGIGLTTVSTVDRIKELK